MNALIIYASRYGSTRLYAEKLSEKTGIPAISYQNAPALFDIKTIIYLGGLYAGGVLGLPKTLRNFSPQKDQSVILITVGLADPEDAENRNNIRTALQKQLPEQLLGKIKLFHLRGSIDYQKLTAGHRLLMKLLYQAIKRTPIEKQSAENRAMIETYGKQVNFVDFNALDAILEEIRQ